MLEGFEDITYDITAKELRWAKYVAQHLRIKIGKKDIVTSKKMRDGIRDQKGWKISDSRMRKILNYIRAEGLVSCLCATSRGYYVAANKQEWESYMRSLGQRIREQQYIQATIRAQGEEEFGKTKSYDN